MDLFAGSAHVAAVSAIRRLRKALWSSLVFNAGM
jgi:hypothetical protein